MANRVGSAAKRSSRLCFTFVSVTTPMAARAPLPIKFAAAEKHTGRLSWGRMTSIIAKRKYFLRCSVFQIVGKQAGAFGIGKRSIGFGRRALHSLHVGGTCTPLTTALATAQSLLKKVLCRAGRSVRAAHGPPNTR